MKILAKIARYYLFVISIYYILMGLGALGPSLKNLLGSTSIGKILGIPFNLGSFLGFAGNLVVVIPNSIISTIIRHYGFELSSSPLLPLLGTIAIMLGAIGFIALIKIERNSSWVYVWYILSGIALLTAVNELYFQPRFPLFIVLNFVHASLFLLATILVHHGITKKLFR